MAKPRKRRDRGFPTSPYLSNRVRDDFYTPIASDFSSRVFEPATVAATPTLEALEEQNYIPSVRSYLSEVEDRRTFHPAGQQNRPAASPRRHLAKTKIQPKLRSATIATFSAPAHVAICVRRKIRDQVLHALKKTGRGSGRPRFFNSFSNVRC